MNFLSEFFRCSFDPRGLFSEFVVEIVFIFSVSETIDEVFAEFRVVKWIAIVKKTQFRK